MIKKFYELGDRVSYHSTAVGRWIPMVVTRRIEVKSVLGNVIGYRYVVTTPGMAIEEPGSSNNVSSEDQIKLEEPKDFLEQEAMRIRQKLKEDLSKEEREKYEALDVAIDGIMHEDIQINPYVVKIIVEKRIPLDTLNVEDLLKGEVDLGNIDGLVDGYRNITNQIIELNVVRDGGRRGITRIFPGSWISASNMEIFGHIPPGLEKGKFSLR